MSRFLKYVGRRNLVKAIAAGGVGLFATTACQSAQTSQQSTASSSGVASPEAQPVAAKADPAVSQRPSVDDLDPQKAMALLVEGNKRFVDNTRANPRQDKARVVDVAVDEFPYAAILCSSDSRVAPEIVFDQGLGDLYVVRILGNVAVPAVIDSLEFAVNTLKVPLILVLGSARESSVDAVLRNRKKVTDNLEAIAPLIKPAVDKVKNNPGNDVLNSVRANMLMQADEIAKNPGIAKLISEKKLAVETAFYDLDTGLVRVTEKG